MIKDNKKESAAQSVPAEGAELLSSNTDSITKISDILKHVKISSYDYSYGRKKRGIITIE